MAPQATVAVTLLSLIWLAISASMCPPQASADGDPASDVLLAQNVFYPYQPKVSPEVELALEKALHSAARVAAFPLKVAIIGTPEELGLVPSFFGRPQAYAEFLDREISFNRPQPLLVVMEAGFGVMPAADAHALAGVPVDKQESSDGLARSAIRAVLALARYRGHPIPTPSISGGSASSSPPALLVFGLPAAVLILAGIGWKLGVGSRLGRKRDRSARRDGDGVRGVDTQHAHGADDRHEREDDRA